MEPVAKMTRIKVPINSTVKICKFEYAKIIPQGILQDPKLLLRFDHEFLLHHQLTFL